MNPLPGSPGLRDTLDTTNTLVVIGRTLKTLAPLALIGASAAAHAQSTFDVDCRSSYLLNSEYDAGMPGATRIKLSDLKVVPGDILTITENGKFSQSKSWPEDTDVLGAVFSRDDRVLDRTNRHRIPGAIRAGTALITANENSKGFLTDISEDFAINPTGTKVVVPSGAQYLFVAAIDSYYADNTSSKGLTVTIARVGTTSGKTRNMLNRLLPASTGLASGANAVAANGIAAGWIAKGDYSEAATFKGGAFSSCNPFGGTAARAYAVDANGNAIGSGLNKEAENHAFLATNKGIFTMMDDAGEALAMNPSGTVVGYKSIWEGFSYPFATIDGKAQLIDTNWNQGVATGINAKGDVVGFAIDQYTRKSIAWISNATKDTRKAVDLGISEKYSAYPVAINDNGQIVGNYMVGNYQTDKPYRQQVRAFVLDKSGFRDLGTLSGGDSVEAAAINNKGQIVGSATTAEGETHAFLYDGGKMIDLGTLDGTDSYATAINDKGQIVGTALDKNGLTQAFSTTPVVVAPVAVSALKMDTNYFAESTRATATVALAEAAPKGGQEVTITTNKDGVVSYSTTVTVEAGATTATFPVYANAAEANVPFAITASSAGKSVSFGATTRSMTLQNFRLSAYTAKANTALAGTFSLELPAMSKGKTITLWSDNAGVTVPSTVTVVAGTQAGTFTAKIGTVAVGAKVTIYAKCGDRTSQTAITISK